MSGSRFHSVVNDCVDGPEVRGIESASASALGDSNIQLGHEWPDVARHRAARGQAVRKFHQTGKRQANNSRG